MNSCCDSTLCGFSLTEENIKKVHFAPDVSEILNLLKGDQNLDMTNDHNISNFESELNTCLERLKNEAAAVLYLTAGKKQDAEEVKEIQDTDAQTELNGDEIIGQLQKIRLQEQVRKIIFLNAITKKLFISRKDRFRYIRSRGILL